MSEQPPQESYEPFFDVPTIVMGIILGMLLVATVDHYWSEPNDAPAATAPSSP